jgi:RNA polymerase sigma-70 factor (ECF subfamily)
MQNVNKNITFSSADIEKIKTDDVEAFGRLYKMFYEALVNFAHNYLNDLESAENVVQDVFFNVWRGRKKLNSQKSIKSYLYQAAKNQSLKQLRHKKIHIKYLNTQFADDVDNESPAAILQYKELDSAVNDAISNLPERCYTVYSLNRFNNLSYKEIAEIQGVSVKAVEKQMTRAFKILKKQLQIFLSMFLI